VLREIIETRTSHIWPSIEAKKIKHFIAIGGEAKQVKEILFGSKSNISMRDFKSICVKALNNDYELRKKVESKSVNWYEFLATMVLYDVFTDLVDSEYLTVPNISLRDGILAELIEQAYDLNRYKHFNNDIYHLAYEISKRYKSSESHIKNIEHNAIMLFEGLNKTFSFNERDELLLRLSAILHEIGKYTRMRDYLVTSYEKLSTMDIFGVKHNEMLIIAHICRLISSSETKLYQLPPNNLTEDEQIRVFKLASILSISDSLDKGKKQRIEIVDTIINDDNFIINVKRKSETILEDWSFEFTIDNFANTFGIIPEIKDVD